MSEESKLLPLGTVVYLREGTTKIMIIGQGPVFEDEGHDVYTDYMRIGYPDGFDPDEALFFNNEQIDKVVFKGYEDDESKRYNDVYNQWQQSTDVLKKQL